MTDTLLVTAAGLAAAAILLSVLAVLVHALAYGLRGVTWLLERAADRREPPPPPPPPKPLGMENVGRRPRDR